MTVGKHQCGHSSCSLFGERVEFSFPFKVAELAPVSSSLNSSVAFIFLLAVLWCHDSTLKKEIWPCFLQGCSCYLGTNALIQWIVGRGSKLHGDKAFRQHTQAVVRWAPLECTNSSMKMNSLGQQRWEQPDAPPPIWFESGGDHPDGGCLLLWGSTSGSLTPAIQMARAPSQDLSNGKVQAIQVLGSPSRCGCVYEPPWSGLWLLQGLPNQPI